MAQSKILKNILDIVVTDHLTRQLKHDKFLGRFKKYCNKKTRNLLNNLWQRCHDPLFLGGFMKIAYLIALCCPLIAHTFAFHRDEEIDTPTNPYAGCSVEQSCNDEKLVKRMLTAYQLAEKHHLTDSMWQVFYDQKLQAIHDVFQSGNLDQATQILRKPSQTDLFYGFDCLCLSILPLQLTYSGRISAARQALDCLLRCGEAMGAIRLDNPETHGALQKKWTANEVLQTLETFLGTSIYFPNPYANEVGIYTDHGIASYRAVQALYQAYRIKELLKDIPHPRVLEIGAGLGRTAYYCKLLGITDYTIIDIPMTALSSSYFLGRILGEDQVVLLGENLDASENKVKILTPDQFLSDMSQYDLIVNADSLTEINFNTISAYLDKIQQISPMFLSINHETNQHTVFKLLSPHVKTFYRYPYWMRLGYVEELYLFSESSLAKANRVCNEMNVN
jgi:hypothetical protein